jgi:hypothetical protein
MRNGDFAVEVVARGKGVGVRETGSGHVLARAGQVYALRFRNFGPLRCVAEVEIDGREVAAGGLVIDPWCTEELERPISEDEDGRFTVVAEGDERVFGPDGGRDNPKLGLIEVRFRRELPQGPERPRPLPNKLLESFGRGTSKPEQPSGSEPEPWNVVSLSLSNRPNEPSRERTSPRLSALMLRQAPERPSSDELSLGSDDLDVERAAGTGLTGHSSQQFTPTTLGPLEQQATRIQLRLVIATVEAIQAADTLVPDTAGPARPAARP